MTLPTTEQRILSILAEQIGVDASVIKLEVPFTEQGIDSLDLVEVLMTIEDDFGIEVPDTQFEEVKTPAQLRALVNKLKGEA